MSIDQKNKLSKEVNHAIQMLGDDHILCIIANVAGEGMRFNQLQRVLDLNPTTLADRLTKLEKEGIVDKQRETVDKISVVYRLTKKGESLLSVVDEFEKFAKKFPSNNK